MWFRSLGASPPFVSCPSDQPTITDSGASFCVTAENFIELIGNVTLLQISLIAGLDILRMKLIAQPHAQKIVIFIGFLKSRNVNEAQRWSLECTNR